MKQDKVMVGFIGFREHDMVAPTLEFKEMRNTLEAFQGFVGGLIDIPYVSPTLAEKGIDMIINDEGKLEELQPTIYLVNKENGEVLDVICGNVIFASHDDEGNTASLSEEQIVFIKKFLFTGIDTANRKIVYLIRE